MTYQGNVRREVRVERKNDRRPMKQKSWTHQDELKSLIGKRLIIEFISRPTLLGVLLNADQFTIQVQEMKDPNSSYPLSDWEVKELEIPRTFYKSAIVGYRECS